MCIVIDLDVVCLVCLHHSQQMHAIFAPDSDTPDLQIAQKITVLSKMKIDANNDSLPDKICDGCLKDLRTAWRFHKNCQTAAVVFQSIFRPKIDPEQVEKLESEEQQMEVTNRTDDAQNSEPQNSTSTIKVRNFENDSNESAAEEPSDDTLLAGCQVVENFETVVELEDNKDLSGEMSDLDQSLVGEEEYLSVPESVDDEVGLVEYYLTEEAIADHTDEFTKSPSTSKENTKFQIISGSPPRKSLLKNSKRGPVMPSSKVPQTESPAGRIRGRRTNTQAPLKVVRPVVVDNRRMSRQLRERAEPSTSGIEQQYEYLSENEDDFELVQKKKTSPRKRKAMSAEKKAPKICELCGNSYRFQHALNAHMRRHYQDKPYPCEMCDKAFVSNVELRRHMRVHTGHKPYGCQYCDRRFSDFGSRIKHERTHTGERPYVCGTCGKAFAYPHVLSVHLRTHTGEKKFRCDHCTKGFTKKAYLLSHVEQHHSGRESIVKKEGDRSNASTYDDDTIVEAEEDDLTHLKSVKFDECIYTAEYVNEEDCESLGGDDGRMEEDVDNGEAQGDDEADENILLQESLLHTKTEDDDGEEEEEVVEVHVDDDTIRVR